MATIELEQQFRKPQQQTLKAGDLKSRVSRCNTCMRKRIGGSGGGGGGIGGGGDGFPPTPPPEFRDYSPSYDDDGFNDRYYFGG